MQLLAVAALGTACVCAIVKLQTLSRRSVREYATHHACIFMHHAWLHACIIALLCLAPCVLDSAAGLATPMDLLGLPINVQRRIALLLHEPESVSTGPSETDATAPVAPDRGSDGQAAFNRGNSGCTSPADSWKLSIPADEVAAQLRQTQAGAVYTNAFGDHRLQACDLVQLT